MEFLFNRWAEAYPQKMGKLIHEELSRKIIGAAMDVLNQIKPGLDEKLSERALVVELRKRGHAVESQKKFPASC